MRDCTERLEQLGITYMLTGLMALAHYVIPRMTAEIGIVLEISKEDIQRFIHQFEPDYYVPHGRMRNAISNQRMFNIPDQTNLIKVDCIIRKSNEYQQAAFKGRKKVVYAGFNL